ncbi:MAG TPA: RNA 2',3'-cyclic phosphodiesterase, partial [Bacteroidales bacterium]|nr:RNA 2',3'-cyclic phosphodiesterase [Bacteroidales bacterium]
MSDSKRLFIGIELNQIHKENLAETSKRLRMFVQEGNVTKKDNYHITLKFLGETKDNRIPVIEETMQLVAGKSNLFLAYMGELGVFEKGKKSTLWMGIKDQDKLEELQSFLDEELEKLF